MENKYKGWIEGFGSVVGNQLGVETKQKVLDQCKMCQQISNDKDMAQCVKDVMIKFDQVVSDKEKRERLWRQWETPVLIIFPLKSQRM